MFDFGLSELVLALVIAIIVIKPSQYPAVFRKIGRAYGYCLGLYHRILNEISFFADSFDEQNDQNKR